MVANVTGAAAAMADARGPVLSPDLLEAYLRDEPFSRLLPAVPTYRGLSPGTLDVFHTPSDSVPGANPPADFPSGTAVQPALAQLAAVPSAVFDAAGGGEDQEDVGARRHTGPGAAFLPMPCDDAETPRAFCGLASLTRA